MDKGELEALYAGCVSVRELARKLGKSHSGATYLLRKHGVEIRSGHPVEEREPEQVDPEEAARWQRLYDEAGSASELARRLGKSTNTITYHLRKHEVDVRRVGYRSPKAVVHFGEDNANWKGGKYVSSGGYVLEYSPHHPDAAKYKGYVFQHRLVMERKLGRYLTAEEIVHHINEDKTDNRPENLELTDRSEHGREHKAVVVRDPAGRFTAEKAA